MIKQILIALGWGTMLIVITVMGLIQLWQPLASIEDDLAEQIPYNEYIFEDEPAEATDDEDIWLVAGMKVATENTISEYHLIRG